MHFNGLTTILQNFLVVFDSGFSRLLPAINYLLWVFGGINLIWIGLQWAMGGGENTGRALRQILFLMFWGYVCTNFFRLAKALVDSLITAGLIAGGQPGQFHLLNNPSAIAGYGLDATQALADALQGVSTFDFADALVFGLAYIAIVLCFLVMALQVFLAMLEYHLQLAVLGILMPFGLFSPLRLLAEKSIGAIASSGIKLMVLSFVIAVVEPSLAGFRFTGTITYNQLWAVLLQVGAIAFLTWQAPGLVAGMLSGAPALAASMASQNAVGAMAVGSTAVGAVSASTRAAVSPTGTVGSGVSRAAGSSSSSTSSGGSATAANDTPRGVSGTLRTAGVTLAQSAVGRALYRAAGGTLPTAGSPWLGKPHTPARAGEPAPFVAGQTSSDASREAPKSPKA